MVNVDMVPAAVDRKDVLDVIMSDLKDEDQDMGTRADFVGPTV